MDCKRFQQQILTFIDGELRGDEADVATAHEAACAPCRERAVFERAFEARIGAALTSGTPTPTLRTPEPVREPEPVSEPDSEREPASEPVTPATAAPAAPPRGRVVRLPLRIAAAAAAVVFVALQGAWFFCIPPFECPYLEAVEETARIDEGPEFGATRCALDSRVTVPPALGSFALARPALIAAVGYQEEADAVVACYRRGDDEIRVLWVDDVGAVPSFRRKETRDGAVWWIAEENERNIVAYMCPKTNTLCTVLGPQDVERLIDIASSLRRPGQ